MLPELVTEVDELAELPDGAVTAVERVLGLMAGLERELGHLAVADELGDAWRLRQALTDFAGDLSERRHRVACALRRERLRRREVADGRG